MKGKTGALFVGPQKACKAFLRNHTTSYIYILRRPDGRPFYIGQGSGSRVFFHENEARHANNWKTNNHKLNVIRSIWKAGSAVTYEIDFVSDDKVVINKREEELIGLFGRLHEGGPLTNRAPGGRSLNEPSPFSKEKHKTTLAGIPDDDPERAILNRFVLAIAPMRSAVLKPLNRSFIPRKTQRNRARLSPSLRQAAALTASAAANSLFLDRRCTLPRLMEIEGVKGFIENGVACDIVVSGMAEVIPATNPADEVFRLSAHQAKAVVDLIGLQKCIDLGIVRSR